MDSVFVLKNILSPAVLNELRQKIAECEFVDGRSTASGMAAEVKNNEQLDAGDVRDLVPLMEKWVLTNSYFRALAFPRAVSNVLVSRYREGMSYGLHSDNAVLSSGHRSDISFTLFLSEADDYEGGELVLCSGIGDQAVKLDAGSLILYPSGVLHRVNTVTRGERLVIVGWVQSHIRDPQQRQMLLDLDTVRRRYLDKVGHDEAADLLLKTSHNLRRLWND